MTNHKKAFIVVGLPRSGTSLVAAILDTLGIPMESQKTNRSDRFNATGYFENMRFANVSVMATHTRTFLDIYNVIDTKINDFGSGLYDQAIFDMNKKFDVWGVKDPRLCFPELFSALTESLSAQVDEIYVVVVSRNLVSVTESFCHVVEQISDTNLPFDKVYQKLLSLQMSFGRCMFSKNVYDNFSYMTTVNYETLVNNPSKEISKLANFCGIPSNGSAIELVKKSLKRF